MMEHGTDAAQPPRRFRTRSLLVGASIVLLATTVFVIAYPVSFGLGRMFLLVAGPALFMMTSGLLWRRRKLRWLPMGLLVVMGLFLLAPGRRPDPAHLRARYATCLCQYEGVRYVWGGESVSGIDCSGLVRRAFIRALLQEGLITVNPGICRTAIDVWLHDSTAEALKDGYRGWTRPVFGTPSLREVPADRIAIGDLAVTVNGKHVLACVGEGRWIEADPGPMKVVYAQLPDSRNPWLQTPMQIVRWRVLEETAVR